MSEESASPGKKAEPAADPPKALKTEPGANPPKSPSDKTSPSTAAPSGSRSRRTFVKAAIVGGAAAAAVGAGWTFLLSPRLSPTLVPPIRYGTYVIWFDAAASLFRRRNVTTGIDEVSGPDGRSIVQDAIAALPTPGGEIWLSTTVSLPSSVVTINRNNVSLVALRDPPPRAWDDPRPHIQKIQYTGDVNGGLLQGIHCREIEFDGTGNQQMVVARDIGMHPMGVPNQQGLRFSGSTGYIQYLEFENLRIALSGPDSTAIEFGNSNPGSGHFAFTGITSIETEYDTIGTPAAVKILPGAETGTPIRIDNLTLVDLPARTQGNGLRPIWMLPQSEQSKGLRLMHIGRLFFEQHFTSPHTIVTIEPAAGAGACWFNLTIDDLAISDEAGKTVNLIENRNGSWMSREQYLRVENGVKTGLGTFSLGTLGLHEYFRVYLGEMSGVTPFGKIATPFTESAPVSFVGPGGTVAAPTTGEYVVAVQPITVTSDQPWALKDPNGVGIETVPIGESRFVPLGYRVQFPSGTPQIFA